MPTSRSPRPSTKPQPLPPQRSRFVGILVVIIVLAVSSVAVIALPASLVGRFLPGFVHAEDFSGSVWHGSAGKVSVNSHEAGALEWRLHPWPLLTSTLSADVHWVMVGFVADATADVDRHGVTASDIRGGGPLEDLGALGVASGWHGQTNFKFSELNMRFDAGSVTLLSVVGDLDISGLASPQVADGADLGGYRLHVANRAIAPADGAALELTDTGGPLEVEAVIHLSANQRTALLSGTVKERPGASEALTNQLDQLAQLHARDERGRIPVDLEFTL